MASKPSAFDLSKCARKNILKLQPYRCAREYVPRHYPSPPQPASRLIQLISDYKDDGTNVLLDANENAYGPGLALNPEGALQDSAANGGSTGSSKPDIDLLGLNRYPDPYVHWTYSYYRSCNANCN